MLLPNQKQTGQQKMKKTTSRKKTTTRKTTAASAAKIGAKPQVKAALRSTAKATLKTVPKAGAKSLAVKKPAAVVPPAKGVKPATAPIVAGVTPTVAAPVLRKKELIERVVAKSGSKKKDAKPAIEAMLEVLGTALANGEELNLPFLGKVMVKRQKEQPKANVMICRIRQPKKPAALANSPLAKPPHHG